MLLLAIAAALAAAAESDVDKFVCVRRCWRSSSAELWRLPQ